MNALTSIIDFFNNYGWAGIIATIVILVICGCLQYFNKKADKRNDKLSEMLIDSFTKIEDKHTEHIMEIEMKLIDTINSTITSHYDNQKQEHKHSENRRSTISVDVSAKLWDMLNTFNAQRAIIMELHNGGVNLNGLSFIRYDITCEKQMRGIKPINSNVQNLPLTNLEVVCKDILESEHAVVIYDRNAIEGLYDRGATVLFSDLTMNLNVTHMIYGGIYNDDNILYAIIALEYHEDYPFPEQLINEVEVAKFVLEISQLYKYVKKY